jgi:hypothetical protein
MIESPKTTSRPDVAAAIRSGFAGGGYREFTDMPHCAAVAAQEIEQLRALVTRLTDVAANLAGELSDPGTHGHDAPNDPLEQA